AMPPFTFERNIMDEKLRILKLIGGEEIVGVIAEDNEETIRIENPCLLGIAMTQSGKPTLQMQPMLLFSEQKVVELKQNHILYNVSVAIEIRNKYNEIYGSGIVVAKKSSILV
ncbi:MAG: hypothetical protein ACO30M_10790, partial [Candidatus Kapaibacteriota bacterium]